MMEKSDMGMGAGGLVMVDKSSMGVGGMGVDAGGLVMVDKSGMGVLDNSGGFLVDAETGETMGKMGGSVVMGKEGVPVSI